MATYKQIQQYVKDVYGYTPKTCWIAHMKEICDLNPKVSPNRYCSIDSRTNPCPPNKQDDLRDSFVALKML